MTAPRVPIVSFVMGGGIGSRLWPLSREDNPKQFHALSGPGSMLARTVGRMGARAGDAADPVYVIAAARHAEAVGASLVGLDLRGGGIVLEPVGRNTAAAVALASEVTLRKHGDRLMLVVPSDHEIATDADFWRTVEAGILSAEAGEVVLFGIVPDRPETGFGYIEAGAVRGPVREVLRFVEKPDRETAERFLAAGTFYWNSGIFFCRASVMRRAFAAHAPDIQSQVARALDMATAGPAGLVLAHAPYAAAPANSVDRAIMERVAHRVVAPASFAWSDLGSWQALRAVGPADAGGNVAVGDVVAIDCRRSYLRSEGRLLAAVGLSDVAIVATADAIFAAPLAESRHVGRVVEDLARAGRREARITPPPEVMAPPGAWRVRVRDWLFDEALPLWSDSGRGTPADGVVEGFTPAGAALVRSRRIGIVAAGIRVVAVAAGAGWQGPARPMVDAGLRQLEAGRTDADAAADRASRLAALAAAVQAGFGEARPLATMVAADLSAATAGGLGPGPALAVLEALLAWHGAADDAAALDAAVAIADRVAGSFFDGETWTLRDGGADAVSPGEQFRWAAALAGLARASGRPEPLRLARKLYAAATANGINRATGLAFAAVSPEGATIDPTAPITGQIAAIAAALALAATGGPDLLPEVETRIARLFRFHIDPAPRGLFVERVDANGAALPGDARAETLAALVSVLAGYLGRPPAVRG
jgi:mannose-1-phosphate guanylyltransferase/mannose-6-phosphate isomerase